MNEWTIRFPRFSARGRATEGGARTLTYATEKLEVRDIQITGGQVTRVGLGAVRHPRRFTDGVAR